MTKYNMALLKHVFRFISFRQIRTSSRAVSIMFPLEDAKSEKSDDSTLTKFVHMDDKLSLTPEKAKTSLINFLEQSDILKRKNQIRIPFFTAGSTMRIIYTDPSSRTGRNHFTGLCIARSNKGLGSTFILRNVIQGVGIERMFELYSPHIVEIQVLKLEQRRRAKLYYLRDKPPKYSTIKETMKPINTGNKILKYRRKGAA